MKLQPKMLMMILVRINKYLIFSNFLHKSKYYGDSNKLDVRWLKKINIVEEIAHCEHKDVLLNKNV